MQEYISPEIISTLERWQSNEKYAKIIGGVKYHQKIQIKCSKCGVVKNQVYKSHRANMLKRLKQDSLHKYLCQLCGVAKAVAKTFKGKNFEEIYGVERSMSIRKKMSENNTRPMLGKPSPQGSGNGWSGWYKGWYFRSLRELSFMIKYIERFNLTWKSLENKASAFPYIDYKGNKRNYFADFLINEKYVVEIKPKALWNAANVRIKKEAAQKHCEEKGLFYKMIDPLLLSSEEIFLLYGKGLIKWLPRYEEKFNLKYNIDE